MPLECKSTPAFRFPGTCVALKVSRWLQLHRISLCTGMRNRRERKPPGQLIYATVMLLSVRTRTWWPLRNGRKRCRDRNTAKSYREFIWRRWRAWQKLHITDRPWWPLFWTGPPQLTPTTEEWQSSPMTQRSGWLRLVKVWRNQYPACSVTQGIQFAGSCPELEFHYMKVILTIRQNRPIAPIHPTQLLLPDSILFLQLNDKKDWSILLYLFNTVIIYIFCLQTTF